MNLKKQEVPKNQNKKFSFKRFIDSIKYSLNGLTYAYANEQSLWLHGFGTISVIIIGLILDISFIQWAIIILSSVVVLSIELLNTSIEATVDMFTKDYNEYAKIAKDCASAAAFVSSLAFAVICGFIFIQKIMIILG